MVHAQNRFRFSAALPIALLFVFSAAVFAQDDPPSRVARLNYINGNVSMEPAGVDEWAPAELNRPFTIGDYLYTDQAAQAELHLDVAVIRMGSQTSFGFLNLDDRTVQLKLTEGDLSVRIRNFGSDQVFEVDTPNAAVTLVRNGLYRFRVDPNGTMSFVVVREGQAEVTGGGQAFTLNADNSATLNGTDQLAYDIELAPQPDEFDQWCQQRDAHEAHLASSRYLPPTLVGYEDLDDYGSWSQAPDYGPVWYPRAVDAGWAPYHYGHWAWIDPWGWTWVDAQPWGFAPFHYGRWAYIGNRWGWCPGPVAIGYRGPAIRPWYAPAMVAWFGGAHWGVGISIGGGPSLGWVPLGWGEVYTPAYHCSPRYFNNVNVYNTRVVKTVNITNVYNTVYVNKTVYNQQYVNVRAPNAVMAMPQNAFANGRMVRQAGTVVRPNQVGQIRAAAVIAPPVAPTRQSFLASAANRPVVRPAAQVIQRPVVARSKPPAEPAPYAARQQFLQQHASTGQPLNIQAMRQADAAHRVEPNVRTVSAATPVAVRPGERGGAAVANRPTMAQPRGGVSGPVEPGRTPATANRPTPNEQRVNPAAPAGQPAATVHGMPPNQQTEMPAQERQAVEPRQPVQSNERVNQPAPNRPQQEVQRPAAATHGVPPNVRQPANRSEDNNNVRYNGRAAQNTVREQQTAQPPARVQSSERPAERAQPSERTQPSQRQMPEHSAQPPQVYREPAQPRNQPTERATPRTQPAERTAYPARSPEPRAQPNRAEPNRAEPNRAEPNRAEPRQAPPSREDHSNSHDNRSNNKDRQ